MGRQELELKYRKKVIINGVEHFVFALFAIQTNKFLKYTLDLKEHIEFYTVILICYLIYYSLSEFFMNKSLIMFLFKVELSKEKRSNRRFVLYAIT